MALHLHIGGEKTGSTAIQRFLRTNRSKLRKMGYYLPNHLGRENHKWLAGYALGPDSVKVPLLKRILSGRFDSFNAFSAHVEHQVRGLWERSHKRNAIISSEDFHRMSEGALIRLSQLLNQFSEIHIYFFIRRQDRLAISRYFQLAKGGTKRARVFPFTGVGKNLFYDFYSYAKMWEQVFPDAIFHLIPYGEFSTNEGRDSIDLIAKEIGFTPIDCERPARLNQSLDLVSARAIMLANENPHLYPELGHDVLLAELKQFTKTDIQPDRKSVEAFFEQYISINDKLGDAFLSGESPFNNSLELYNNGVGARELDQLAKERLMEVYRNKEAQL